MVLFVLTGAAPPILVVTLLVMAYLTGYELNKEEDVPFLWKAWWVLLVILLNVVGFGIFWIWLARRRYKAAGRSRHPPERAQRLSSRTRCSLASLSASSSESRSSCGRSRLGDALDPVEPLADGVRVHVERPGGGGDAAAVGEVLLEGLDEAGAAAAVVLGQRLDRLAIAVARRLITLEVDQVAVGAELLVADRAALDDQGAPDPRRVGGLAHPAPGAGRAPVEVTEADHDPLLDGQRFACRRAARSVTAGPSPRTAAPGRGAGRGGSRRRRAGRAAATCSRAGRRAPARQARRRRPPARARHAGRRAGG